VAQLEQKLAKRLKQLRKQKKLTQEKLAEKSGLDYKFVQRLESRNAQSPTVRTLAKLGKALDLEPWEIIKFE